jgi:hypothetical protein
MDFRRGPALPCSFSLLAVLAAVPVFGAETVSFGNDVMAVLSRGGCNSGACHGNQNGKNGFKLSLRGEGPDLDLLALTRDTHGRRVNVNDPAGSLLLLKATAVVPHEGGKRFDAASPEYQILKRWIIQGAQADRVGTPTLARLEVTPRESVLVEPDASVKVRARAVYTDGTSRDVTALSVFEATGPAAEVGRDGTVRRERFGEAAVLVRHLDRQAVVRVAFVPARPGFKWRDVPEANYIDKHLLARLRTLRMSPSDLCPDEVFLRRAYLDTLGRPATVKEAREFLADTRADRRARLVDDLLRRPEFADFWALKWSDLLRNEEKVLDRKGVRVFHGWLRQSFAEGKPLNELARELIAARGSTYGHPEANYYRALRDVYARAETTAQVFLGVRLQCAKCHNHPFDRWTQADYHALAAFFPRVKYRIVENRRRDRFDLHEFDGEQVVWQARRGEWSHPRTGETLAPTFLGGQRPKLVDGDDRLRALADWVADPDNPFFARAQANRVWYHLMGRGIVEPNDDFRASNPPSNPALLDALADDLKKHGFDLRHLVRTIMTSRAYQLSAVPNETNGEDEANFARALVRPLPAEPLLDALAQAAEVAPEFADSRPGTRAVQLAGVLPRRQRGQKQPETEKFLFVFGKPVRSLSCECERSDDTTLAQVLQLITGKLLNEMLAKNDNRLGRLLKEGKSDADIVEELYLAALNRYPKAEEKAAAGALVVRAKDRRAALEDILWGLLNSKEFLLRR